MVRWYVTQPTTAETASQWWIIKLSRTLAIRVNVPTAAAVADEPLAVSRRLSPMSLSIRGSVGFAFCGDEPLSVSRMQAVAMAVNPVHAASLEEPELTASCLQTSHLEASSCRSSTSNLLCGTGWQRECQALHRTECWHESKV